MSNIPMSKRPQSMNRPVSRGQTQQAAQNVTDVQIQARLISSIGIPASRAKSARRTVKDKVYYESAVRNQIQSLGKEIDAIQSEIQRLEQVGQSVAQLQQKNQEQLKINKQLANQIADSNATLNLINEAKNIQEFTQEVTTVEQQVKQLRNDANIAYKAEQDAKEDYIQNQKRSLSLQNAIKQRISNELGEAAAQEYQDLLNDNKQMSTQIEKLTNDLEKVNQEFNEAFSASFINENEFIGKAVDLKKQIWKNQRQYNQLTQQIRNESSSTNQTLIQNYKQQINQVTINCKQKLAKIKLEEQLIEKRREILQNASQTQEFVVLSSEQKNIIKNVLKAQQMVKVWPTQRMKLVSELGEISQQVEEAVAALVSVKPGQIGQNGEKIDVEGQIRERSKELEKLTIQQDNLLNDLISINEQLLEQQEKLQKAQAALAECQNVENVEEKEKQLTKTMQEEQEKFKAFKEQKAQLQQQLQQIEEENAKDDKFNASDAANKTYQNMKFKLYDQERKLKDQENQTQYKEEKEQTVNLLGQLQRELSSQDQDTENDKKIAYEQLQYAFQQIEEQMSTSMIEAYAQKYGLCKHLLLINSVDNLTKDIPIAQAPLALPMIHAVMHNMSRMESVASFILFCDGIEKDKKDKTKFQRMLQVIVYHKKFSYVRSYFINKIEDDEDEQKGFYIDQQKYFEDWKRLEEKQS